MLWIGPAFGKPFAAESHIATRNKLRPRQLHCKLVGTEEKPHRPDARSIAIDDASKRDAFCASIDSVLRYDDSRRALPRRSGRGDDSSTSVPSMVHGDIEENLCDRASFQEA